MDCVANTSCSQKEVCSCMENVISLLGLEGKNSFCPEVPAFLTAKEHQGMKSAYKMLESSHALIAECEEDTFHSLSSDKSVYLVLTHL